jgi:hypothetical protein
VLPVRELSDQSAHAVHSLMTTPNPKLALSQLRRGRPEPPSLPPPVNASNAALLLSLQPSFQYMPPRADAMRDAHARVALATGAAPRPPCAAAARARDATAAAADGAEDDDEECEGALDWSPSECERAKKRPHQRRTAPWTRTEDEVISEAVNQFGCRWGILAALLPGRTCASVRNRWHRLKSARKLREGSAAEPAADGELDDDDSDGAADDDDASHALAPPVAPPRAAPAVAPAAAPASPIAPGFALPMTTPVAGASRRLASRSGFVGCGYKCSRCGQPKRGHLCTGVRDETDQAAYDAAQQRMRSLVWQQVRARHARAHLWARTRATCASHRRARLTPPCLRRPLSTRPRRVASRAGGDSRRACGRAAAQAAQAIDTCSSVRVRARRCGQVVRRSSRRGGALMAARARPRIKSTGSRPFTARPSRPMAPITIRSVGRLLAAPPHPSARREQLDARSRFGAPRIAESLRRRPDSIAILRVRLGAV